jgi:hypothetical protein
VEQKNVCSSVNLKSHLAIPFNQSYMRSHLATSLNQNQKMLRNSVNLKSHLAIPFNQSYMRSHLATSLNQNKECGTNGLIVMGDEPKKNDGLIVWVKNPGKMMVSLYG